MCSIKIHKMEKSVLTPEESLLLISKTIEDTKNKFKESGFIFIFWGFLMLIVTLSQFILLKKGLYEIHWYPCFLYPLGAIFTFIYFWKLHEKKNIPGTVIGNILATLGWLLGLNLMLLGFFFSEKLGEAVGPVFLIFISFWIIISGISIKFKPLVIGGAILNLLGYASFYFTWVYQPLFMAIGSVIAVIIPGLILNKKSKKEYV